LPAYDPDPSPIPVEAIGYVTTPYLNVRTGPGLDQPVIGRLWQGERVALLGRNTNGAWLQVRLASNSKGWVSSRYIQSSVPIYTLPVTEVGIPEPLPINGYVTAPTLNLRSGPGLYYNIVGRLNQGQQVSVYGRDITGEWYKVGLANGAQGWVASRYIQLPVAAAELKVL
jgi:N-acetylmuramoyl-L-alanine amidase